MRCIDRAGPTQTTLSDVAAELSVTRQTVYRYFPGTDELFGAVGEVAVEAFVDDLTAHLRWKTEPAEWVVEALASAIERLPNERYLTLLLAAGWSETFARGMTSEAAMRIARTLLDRSRVDWRGAGLSSTDVDGLIEVMVRFLQSMILDPPDPPRVGTELRHFLRRWIAPSVLPVPVAP